MQNNPKSEKELATFCPKNLKEWRDWLQKHHISEPSVWLIYYKKKSKVPSVVWSDAVDEALCFGWIDSTARPLDDERYMQFFTKRKEKSVWSKINKDKVERLIQEGRMTPAGLAIIEKAKQNGSWTILDEAEACIIPPDLQKALDENPQAKSFFHSLSRSDKKNMLQWLVLAKRPETRQKRISEIVERASQQMKPKQF